MLKRIHRHASIMFSDIVGYTALMGSDEDRAFEVLRKNREIHVGLIEKFNGTLKKEIGDGLLISFNLASDAVRCAIEIQEACKEQEISLKIGIHEGEMVFVGKDVLGDGVNIASRLQEDAQEGCINISGSIYWDIKNKPGILAEFVEEKSFKNVDEPVKVYQVICDESTEQITNHKPQIAPEVESIRSINHKSRLLNYIAGSITLLLVIAFVLWEYLQLEKTVVLEKSIAVLHFKDLSEDQSNQYFCDGIMEGVLNHLSKIKGLRVVSRTSTEKYRENAPLAQLIAKELNISYLLEASVFKSENKIRVTTQLINAINDEHLWSKQYDRELSDLFKVMSEIATKVASEIKVVIAPEVAERIEAIPTDNLEAFEAYLKGQFHWFKLTPSDLEISLQYYNRALEKDSDFAPAWVGISKVWTGMSQMGFKSPFEAYPKIISALAKAMELDSTIAEAHYNLALIKASIDWDWKEAEKEFRQAIKLNNSYVEAMAFYSSLLTTMGRFEEAEVQIGKALRLDPFNALIQTLYGNYLLAIDQYDRAEEQYYKALSTVPNHPIAQDMLRMTLHAKGMLEESMELGKELYASWGYQDVVNAMENGYATGGYNLAMSQSAEALVRRSDNSFVGLIQIALEYAYAGNEDLTIKWLTKAFESKNQNMPYINIFPVFDNLHVDPKFNELSRRMNLPE